MQQSVTVPTRNNNIFDLILVPTHLLTFSEKLTHLFLTLTIIPVPKRIEMFDTTGHRLKNCRKKLAHSKWPTLGTFFTAFPVLKS